MRLFYCEWIDSKGPEGWISLNEAETEDLVIKSVGWLVGENSISVTIASHVDSASCHSPMTIPKPSLLKWEEIELVDVETKTLQ